MKTGNFGTKWLAQKGNKRMRTQTEEILQFPIYLATK